MASVAPRNRPHKKHPALEQLDERQIEHICRDLAHHHRDSTLTPAATIRCFAWQILMGNVSCDAVRHSQDNAFSASAYCQARQRLPLAVLQELSQWIVQQAQALAQAGKDHRWLGHRVLRIDGSGTQLFDSRELRDYFGCSGKQKAGCGYPTAHLLLMVGAGGVAIDCICSPLRTGDMTHVTQLHMRLQAHDLVIGDRLFSNWGHLYSLQNQSLHGLFPTHHSRTLTWGAGGEQNGTRRVVKRLGYFDQLVEYRKPKKKPAWMSQKMFEQAPQWIRVREAQREVTIGGRRRRLSIVTTLLDPKKYPAKALLKLLKERWLIELNLRSLKTTMGSERLHCQTVDGVLKELKMYLIVYNLVRMLMLKAAIDQGVSIDRVSFADALACLRFGGEMHAALRLKINPLRPGRIEPRVVKQRPKHYPRMTQPRAQLRATLLADQKTRAA